MPTDTLSGKDWRENMAAVLRAIDPPVGHVEPRKGGTPRWTAGSGGGIIMPVFWEVSIIRTLERGTHLGSRAIEIVTFRIDGFLPIADYASKSEDVFDDAKKRLRDGLRSNPTLKIAGVPTCTSSLARQAETALPQEVENNVVTFATGIDRIGDARCHHCAIEFTVDRIFSYTLA